MRDFYFVTEIELRFLLFLQIFELNKPKLRNPLQPTFSFVDYGGNFLPKYC